MATRGDGEGKPLVAIVTGAGRGIGRAIAWALAEAGFQVAAVSREPADTRPDMAPPGGRYYQADIADIEDQARLIDQITGDLGPASCLVNNAGITSKHRGDLLDLQPDSYDATLAVNLRGAFFLSQTFAKRLIAADLPGPKSLIFIGSANAEIVGENRADYCISKAGVGMMNKLFAARLAEHQIGVYEIRPGIIHTDMTAPATAKYDPFIATGGVPLKRWGEPEDIAAVAVTLATGALPYTTGIHIDVGGGLQLYRI